LAKVIGVTIVTEAVAVLLTCAYVLAEKVITNAGTKKMKEFHINSKLSGLDLG
jgi:hypothetical protein